MSAEGCILVHESDPHFCDFKISICDACKSDAKELLEHCCQIGRCLGKDKVQAGGDAVVTGSPYAAYVLTRTGKKASICVLYLVTFKAMRYVDNHSECGR